MVTKFQLDEKLRPLRTTFLPPHRNLICNAFSVSRPSSTARSLARSRTCPDRATEAQSLVETLCPSEPLQSL